MVEETATRLTEASTTQRSTSGTTDRAPRRASPAPNDRGAPSSGVNPRARPGVPHPGLPLDVRRPARQSAGVAWVAQTNARLLQFAADNWFILLIAQIALVVAISWGIRRISATVALGLFFVYAASMGLTLGAIVSVSTRPWVASVDGVPVAVGDVRRRGDLRCDVTKREPVAMGGILFMGLIGLIVASVDPEHLPAEQQLTWVISIVGVVIFTALTAYDVQRIQNGDLAVSTGSMEKAAVIGALSLYLDFINLFLFLLRMFGGRDYAPPSAASMTPRPPVGGGSVMPRTR